MVVVNNNEKAKPFIKWAGGKTNLLPQLAKKLPKTFNAYHEPFLGSGAMFFYLNNNESYLSDRNAELISCYRALKSDVNKVIRELNKLKSNISRIDYNKIKKSYNRNHVSPFKHAAYFIYLNKVGFNGLYRVNSNNIYNVPFGSHKHPSIFHADQLLIVSKRLKRANLFSEGFEGVLKRAKKGDFVYLDPPYLPLKEEKSFTSYTKDSFGKDEHIELATIFNKLNKKGVKVMLSNSNSPFIRSLYSKYKKGMSLVSARRLINCNYRERNNIKELLITNYS